MIAGLQGNNEAAGDAATSVVPDVNTMLEQVRAWIADPQVLKEDLLELSLTIGPRLLGGIAVLVIGVWIAKRIRNIARKALLRARADDMLAGFISNLVYFALFAFVVVSALATLGVETTNFAVIIASAGFAIGFALQGSLGNLAAGVMVLIFKPFKKGDFIEGAGHAGVVEEVGTFMTVLKTGDNKRIIIPNGELTASSLVNYSSNPTRRIDLVIGIGYGDDIDKARSVLERVLGEDSRVLADPAPQIAVSELGESSVNFVVRPWVQSADYWAVRFDLIEAIKKTFDEQGISIPHQQRDVHMHQAAD